MAQNMLNSVGLRGVFLSNTVALFVKNYSFCGIMLKNVTKDFVPVAAKIGNYLVLPSMFQIIEKYQFSGNIILASTFTRMHSVPLNLLQFFSTLIYINLLRICQR